MTMTTLTPITTSTICVAFVRRQVGRISPGKYVFRGEILRLIEDVAFVTGDVTIREASPDEKREWWDRSERTGNDIFKIEIYTSNTPI